MKKSTHVYLVSMASLVALLLVGFSRVSAQPQPIPQYFIGTISDYTPQTGGGSWEVRGTWSLTLSRFGHSADFSAAINMTHDDYWVTQNPSAVNDNTASGRHPHTHHIMLKDAAVADNVNGCLLEVSGKATVTADGAFPPFDPTGTNPSLLVVCVTGGSTVAFSNVTLTFSAPASGHFGPQAIHGVIRKTAADAEHDDHDGGDHGGHY